MLIVALHLEAVESTAYIVCVKSKGVFFKLIKVLLEELSSHAVRVICVHLTFGKSLKHSEALLLTCYVYLWHFI